jgi:putative endonuclease
VARTRSFIPVAEWEDERQLLGLHGERVAIAFLTSCGWSVEAHRFKLGRHDLDLIIRKGSTVAFVEVKTRRSARCGTAVEAVTARKQRDIARVASVWMLRHGRPGDEYRFDLLAVWHSGSGAPAVEHIPDAWRPIGYWSS